MKEIDYYSMLYIYFYFIYSINLVNHCDTNFLSKEIFDLHNENTK